MWEGYRALVSAFAKDCDFARETQQDTKICLILLVVNRKCTKSNYTRTNVYSIYIAT